ncbi:alpha/beta hydrolase [Ramlibacter sp. G-1-2-2]|uniref:Alpha/beta hydrolase n=1 Tax=Ramlibacter agri TaxID=2728837 RepID=A0A848H960_9BURK|nr:alpha/beta hydrolase [Ramlibacter agri]NML44188.1 alpha/beta hydrolase [Ramlibacter agri]
MEQEGVAQIDWAGRPVRIEYQWVGSGGRDAPVIVFLHEGLGSVAMWRDFPAKLCEAAGARGLVYSRPGYGRSTPRLPEEKWRPDFMHRQAREVLPALLQSLGIDPARDELWLFGHSDGGSIALLYAAMFPTALQGAIVLAPHILVEDVSVTSIEQARVAYETTDLKQRLARYHDDVDSAFRGWNDIWLDPAFRAWSIEDEIAAIRCPVLAVQGLDDEYGTLEQIRGIARRVPGTQLLELPDCGHSPHKDQPQAVIAAARAFLLAHRARAN